MIYKVYIGIDPGESGAIVFLTETDKRKSVKALKLKDKTETEILSFMKDSIGPVIFYGGQATAVLEKVHSMPRQGVASTFKFGMSYGGLRMALHAAEIPFNEVTPHKWQTAFSLPTLKQCNDSITMKKNAHKARAQELFPGLKITHATADALLLAEYCRRMNIQGGF